MPTPCPVPLLLDGRPFTLAEARGLGVSEAVLRGRRYRRLFAGVYVTADTAMSLHRWLGAALMVVPPDAVVTSLTALRVRGVEVGPRRPLRLVTTSGSRVRRDRLDVTRALVLPPHDARLASAEHSFLAACEHLDLVDAVIGETGWSISGTRRQPNWCRTCPVRVGAGSALPDAPLPS